MTYVDSSLMLARYLGEPREAEAEEIWNSDQDFFTSALTVAETIVALRRKVVPGSPKRNQKWLKAALDRADSDFQTVNVIYDLAASIALLRHEPRLSSCRAADAIHLASALWFQHEVGRPVILASFDSRQRDVAVICGLNLLPLT